MSCFRTLLKNSRSKSKEAPAAPEAAANSAAHPGFRLWSSLAQGKHDVLSYPLCKVLLFDDSNYPAWLVLVPQVPNVTEVIDLSEEDQAQLWREVAAACRALRAIFRPTKLNIGAIGNYVSQLHLHVTARDVGDPSWPGPCYGAVPAAPHAPFARQALIQRLRKALLEHAPRPCISQAISAPSPEGRANSLPPPPSAQRRAGSSGRQ
ncbi:hypothetical protein WJX81_008115 [Elliptochloris bilobata]|uniref:HIT domain-containing protein n=1 Tax=Elliptochloris bilobata TaxID=381761 RepID=A0AAW1RU91_9CHLO